MPPKLSPDEKAIGRRLREVREKLLIPLRKLATSTGLQPGTLASYEKGRTALSLGAFSKIRAQTGISAGFILRDGKLPDPLLDQALVAADLSPETRFSTACGRAMELALFGVSLNEDEQWALSLAHIAETATTDAVNLTADLTQAYAALPAESIAKLSEHPLWKPYLRVMIGLAEKLTAALRDVEAGGRSNPAESSTVGQGGLKALSPAKNSLLTDARPGRD